MEKSEKNEEDLRKNNLRKLEKEEEKKGEKVRIKFKSWG
jgi:hypothetical protein